MGEKTTGNDLDNANIRFDDVWLARETLLDRHCDVTPAGDYTHRGGEVLSNMELIGQRLFTVRPGGSRRELWVLSRVRSRSPSLHGTSRLF
jgi:hypothetical protein